MNEKITVRLANGRITELTAQSAKIAIEHLGAVEIKTPLKPKEIGTRTIQKPIPIITGDDLGTKTPEPAPIIINDDLGYVKQITTEPISPIKIEDDIKKTRKKRTPSKSKK